MVDDERGYLLGTRDDELIRLEEQHRVWSDRAQALWRRAGFDVGQRIADIGCGPGFGTVDLARRVGPTGSVLGIDGSQRFLDHLEREARGLGLDQVQTLGADINRLELPRGELDGAYARWLFCFLPDPAAVVQRIARGLRPGGRLAIQDYFNYQAFTFAPRSAALDRVVEAVQQAWRQDGGSLDVQAAMPRFLVQAGFEIVDIRAYAHAARPGEPMFRWPAAFFRNFLPTLESRGLIDSSERDAFWSDWESRENDRAAFLFLPPQIEIVARKP